ncbi:MAG: DUF853 family protein [Bacillota bacterium]|nr:DUF853 family protein [Bacillota bacterium]
MYYNNQIWIGQAGDQKVSIIPKMANRHGLIAGATGTGKTVSLKVLAESFSDMGVPVFMADVKGDLSGMVKPGVDSENMQKRIEYFGLSECGFTYQGYPSTYWDIFGKGGIPVRTTISEMGPLLLAKLLELNPTQSSILEIVFKIADDEQLLLIDTKDLKAMLNHVAENAKSYSSQYGNMTVQSINVIIRAIVSLEAKGADQYFGETGLKISDWFTKENGKGMINILDCRSLIQDSSLYSTFLLWMLSELFETLPEVGDLDKPRMVFFFDEAHLLFNGISKALLEKIEQVVKLIRSKGIGVYFITQNPSDIPDSVLAQLGNKIQHALRAYTPKDEKAIKSAAASFRKNPDFDTVTVLQNLGVGEALVSVLDEEGVPTIVQQCKILPPQSFMSAISDEEREQLVKTSDLYLRYKDYIDPDSAYEFLERLHQQQELEVAQAKADAQKAKEQAKLQKEAEKQAQKEAEKAKKQKQKAIKNVANSASGTVGREIGKAIGGSVGGKFGKTLGGNIGASLGRSILGTFFKG